jgi:hypothetical protein
MATATKPAKGFKLVCPFCGDSEGGISIELTDLRKCTCSACGDEFTPQAALAKAVELVAKWQAVVTWVESAPVE